MNAKKKKTRSNRGHGSSNKQRELSTLGTKFFIRGDKCLIGEMCDQQLTNA